MDDSRLDGLSDDELVEFVRHLRTHLLVTGTQLEDLATPRHRNIKLARATFLTAGGFFGATLEFWALIIALVGIWDWVDVIKEDAWTYNRQMTLSRTLRSLNKDLDGAEAELLRRRLITPDETS